MARSRSPPPCHRLKDTSNCPRAYQQSRVRNGQSRSSVSRSPKRLVASFLRIFKKKSVSELPSFDMIGSDCKAASEVEQCVICLDNKRVVLFRPCKHCICCIKCTRTLASNLQCP